MAKGYDCRAEAHNVTMLEVPTDPGRPDLPLWTWGMIGLC